MARQTIDCSTSATAVNRDTKLFIDLTPCESTPTYTRVCAKITNLSDDSSETIEERDYCSGKETEVTEFKQSVGVSGHADMEDPMHNYVQTAKGKTGAGRRTNAMLVYPSGRIYEGPATLTDIKDFGGDMSNRLDFSFNVAFDSGDGMTIINPNDSIDLGAFPTPVWDLNGASSTLTLTFSNDTTRPIENAFADKFKIIGTDGTNIVTLDYTSVVDTTETEVIYTLTFDESTYTDFAAVNYGVYTYAGKLYDQSTYQYEA